MHANFHCSAYMHASNNSNEREQFAKKECYIIQIRMATEVMTVLIEPNNFSGRDLHFPKYDGQTETH